MLTDFQKRKLVVEFLLFDRDHDGVVEADDFRGVAAGLAAENGWSDGSSEATRIRAAYESLWDAFWSPADTDGDGRVNLEERFQAVAYFESMPRDEAKAAATPVIRGLFDALDTDDDGYISVEEYARFLRANGAGADAVTEAVQRVVGDQDGQLSRDEYVDLMFDYYLSDDQEVRANWAFGVR